MSDERETIKGEAPRFGPSSWAILLIAVGSSVGAAIGVFGTNAMRANFFISFNAVMIPVCAFVPIRSRMRRKKNVSPGQQRD